MNRRRFLRGAARWPTALCRPMPAALAATPLARAADGGDAPFDAVLPGRPLRFPEDHGAHPLYRTEWWYVTGWLRSGALPRTAADPAGWQAGFQVTFFRSRTRQDPANQSRFAPRQLLFAHAALARPAAGLRHAQRAARVGFGLARADSADTAVAIGDWSLVREPDDRYRARVDADDFAYDLRLAPAGPPVPQGNLGHSRKGARVEQASWYYSRPRLSVAGFLRAGGHEEPVTGIAWLDHEWSSEQLDADATGWDWVGLNFDDGTALMAFAIRRRGGGFVMRTSRRIAADGGVRQPDEVPSFEPLRWWTSPHTGTRYPVAMRLSVGGRTYELEPLVEDQELDARPSTGVLYWEGAVTVREGGHDVGRGYLELTGYGSAVRY